MFSQSLVLASVNHVIWEHFFKHKLIFQTGKLLVRTQSQYPQGYYTSRCFCNGSSITFVAVDNFITSVQILGCAPVIVLCH